MATVEEDAPVIVSFGTSFPLSPRKEAAAHFGGGDQRHGTPAGARSYGNFASFGATACEIAPTKLASAKHQSAEVDVKLDQLLCMTLRSAQSIEGCSQLSPVPSTVNCDQTGAFDTRRRAASDGIAMRTATLDELPLCHLVGSRVFVEEGVAAPPGTESPGGRQKKQPRACSAGTSRRLSRLSGTLRDATAAQACAGPHPMPANSSARWVACESGADGGVDHLSLGEAAFAAASLSEPPLPLQRGPVVAPVLPVLPSGVRPAFLRHRVHTAMTC